MNNNNNNNNMNNSMPNNEEDEISFSEIFFHYLKYWRWIALSIVVCMCLAFVYVRYSTRLYTVYSKVLVKDDQYGRSGYDMNAFSDLGLSLSSSALDNEIEVINSESMINLVKDSLNLNVEYYELGRFKTSEIYKNTPYIVTVSNQTSWGSFILDKAEDDKFTIKSESPEDFEKTFSLNDEVNSPWGILRLKKNPYGNFELPIKVVIRHPRSAPYISITPVNKMASVVYVTTNTATPSKGVDIVNTLMHFYNKQTIDNKNQVAKQTISFIDARLEDLEKELFKAEKKAENYKQDKAMTDIEAEARLFLSTSSEYSKMISETETQIEVLSSVKNYLRLPENAKSIAPANVGITDPTILSLMKKYNDEIISRNALTLGMTANNPVLQEYDDRIALLKDELIKGIDITEASMRTILAAQQRQENLAIAKVRNLSTQEREWGDILRQKELKETLFVYLLQKREETSLSLNLATSNAIVIDRANFNPNPVAPKTRIIYLAAFLIGFIIPIVLVYIKDLFDNKLHDGDELEKAIGAPLLGTIPLTQADDKFPVLKARSKIAERFRIVISSLSFVLKKKEGSKFIMITSSYGGEGKSFFSKNLAMSLTATGERVLLIDMDMRKSTMNETLGLNPDMGLAMFLSDSNINIKDIIVKGEHHENLDIIPIKVFPPNPAELLLSSRLSDFFENVRSLGYDYVIIDTPPVGLVADAFWINEHIDASIYVTRSDYTYKSSLKEIKKLYRENKLKNMSLIINAVKDETANYSGRRHNYYHED
ncbi:tyrosine-protein kinase Etk/Wzc [Dysgonomonadaceae bacterium PH5-43]|nr:tyrosine-protein kinase Etk/Wzc [Dysgonomonadaceae bacterium PH5-43]